MGAERDTPAARTVTVKPPRVAGKGGAATTGGDDVKPFPYAAANEPTPSRGYPLAVEAFTSRPLASVEVFPEVETPEELRVRMACAKSAWNWANVSQQIGAV